MASAVVTVVALVVAEDSNPPPPLLKEREVHAAVGPMVYDAWMIREILCLSVFQDKESVLTQQLVREDDVGQLLQLWQRIGRVGKDEVELLMAFAQETENISPDGKGIQVLQLLYKPADKAVVQGVCLYGYNPAAATAQQFQGDTACA